MLDMVDPRTVRTREHVLSVCRAMLVAQGPTALTFSAVAARSEVSRATLYRHWDTAEAMLLDAVATDPVEASSVSGPGTATTGSVYQFLRGVRADLTDPSRTAAVSGLIAQAVRHDPSGRAVQRHVGRYRDEYVAAFGRISTTDFAALVGPVFYLHFFVRAPVSDATLYVLAQEHNGRTASARRQQPRSVAERGLHPGPSGVGVPDE